MDLQEGRFSFGEFYVKRIRRLFPALIFTLLLTLIAAYFFLAESGMPRLGKVATAAMISISNFFFLGEQGYFDSDAFLKPLLHTWSLAVEEQFYLLWPILLFVLYKLKTKVAYLVFGILFLLSVSLGYYFFETNPNMVFYMFPFRVFEFLFGVFALVIQQRTHAWVMSSRNFFVSLGLILAFFAVLTTSSSTFQSTEFAFTYAYELTAQLICCLGAMFVIAFGVSHKNILSTYIFDKPLASIGKASYSIYLIHWPLIVFYKMYRIEELWIWEKGMLVLLSIGLGYLMWRYVENTFRYQNSKGAFKIWMPLGIIGVLALSAFYYNIHVPTKQVIDDQQVQKSTPKLLEDDLESEMKRYWKNAEPNSPILKGSNDKNLVVMGNSHAVDLIYAFRRNGLKAEITSMPSTHLCYHFGSQAILPKDEKKCEKIKERHLRNKIWNRADVVFLHDHWPVEETKELENFVLELRKKTKAPIYVFGPKMVFKSTIPQLVKASGTDEPKSINDFAVKFSDLKSRIVYDEQLQQVFASRKMSKKNIHYVSLLGEAGLRDIISPETHDYFYFDKSHLTELGAIELGKRMKVVYPELFLY